MLRYLITGYARAQKPVKIVIFDRIFAPNLVDSYQDQLFSPKYAQISQKPGKISEKMPLFRILRFSVKLRSEPVFGFFADSHLCWRMGIYFRIRI
jgi:hypothetical protein